MSTLTLAASYVVWEALADESFVLSRGSNFDAVSRVLTAEADTGSPHPTVERRTWPGGTRLRTTASRWSPATVMEGTTVAVPLVIAMNGSAYVVIRALVRRRRRETPRAGEKQAAVPPPIHAEPTSPSVEAQNRPEARAVCADRKVEGLSQVSVQQRTTVPRRPVLTPRDQLWDAVRDNATVRGDRVVLYDALASTRVAYTSLARLEWDGNEMWATTTHLGLRDVSCILPEGRQTPPLPERTTIRVTLPLKGTWVTLSTCLAGYRTDQAGRIVDLRLVEIEESHRALLIEATRRSVNA